MSLFRKLRSFFSSQSEKPDPRVLVLQQAMTPVQLAELFSRFSTFMFGVDLFEDNCLFFTGPGDTRDLSPVLEQSVCAILKEGLRKAEEEIEEISTTELALEKALSNYDDPDPQAALELQTTQRLLSDFSKGYKATVFVGKKLDGEIITAIKGPAITALGMIVVLREKIERARQH